MLKTMKHIILTTMMAATAVLHSQMDYEKYSMNQTSKSYKIQVTEKGELYIDIMSLDPTSREAGIILKKNKSEDFILCLQEAKSKFTEWKQIAVQNGVKKLRKPIECGCSVSSYFSYGKWQFDFSVYPEFAFLVLESGGTVTYSLVVNTGELQSSSNQFMDSDGGIIVFMSEKEVDSFISKINPAAVEKFLAKPKADDLFK
jgi:hypothetical protein